MNELSCADTSSASVLKVEDLVQENPKLEAERSLRRRHERDGSRIKRRTIRGLREYFWERVDIRGPEECWEFKLQPKSSRPTTTVKLKLWHCYRLAWLLHHGWLRTDLKVCHTCDNGRCCNPNHLFQGTQLDNMRDMVAKGRKAVGVKCNRSSLTEFQVREIREIWSKRVIPITAQALGEKFGVTDCTILNIVSGKTWRHVP